MGVGFPVRGDWYKRTGGYLFEVVAIDEEDATIEIQHFDGTVEEIELEAWMEGLFESAQPPEDWSGSVDIDPEDYGTDQDGLHNWSSPLDYLDRAE